jgi:hypothetical protein
MSRYVILHKLNRGFKEWEFHGNEIPGYRETVPYMTEEFCDWYRENQHLVKTVHTQRMVELDRTQIAFEFHSEEEALVCMLRFG